jgi:hypothetical protein
MSARLVVSAKVTSASAPTPSMASRRENSSGFPSWVKSRSVATRSTSSSTTMDGWRRRASAAAWSMKRMDRPVSKMIVLLVRRPVRYRMVCVLPVPGGPCKSRPRLRCWPASRSSRDHSAMPMMCCSMFSSMPSGRTTSCAAIAGRGRNVTSSLPWCSLAVKLSTCPRNTSCTRISRSISSRVAVAAPWSAASMSRLQNGGPNRLSSRIPIRTGAPSGAVDVTRPNVTTSVFSSGPTGAVP